ncbi:MAG: 2-oxoacid:ferredoxin oxidoreductase subunit gamma [Desulfitibacter sp. BRH_c19]|nr:MAG: 2-oxoacid:ferredoxin oxidoreductase subunit gamma [Desulfitibacter sp. BRH_c19]
MKHELIFAGFGGQGIMSMGKVLSYAAMLEGKHVMFIPAYGSEMRGGTASCTVIISDRSIDAPVAPFPSLLVAMNSPSLDRFQPRVRKNGIIIINATILDKEQERHDVKNIRIPADKIATDLGNEKVSNMVILGAVLKCTECVAMDYIMAALKKTLPERHHKMLPLNEKALYKGIEMAEGGVNYYG